MRTGGCGGWWWWWLKAGGRGRGRGGRPWGPQAGSLPSCVLPSLRGRASLAPPATADNEEEEEAEEEAAAYTGPSKARRRAWQRIKYWRRRAAEDAAQAAADEAREAAEAAADAKRGPPPAPSRGFRLPQECVPRMLMVWEFCQVFGDVLQLPPFSMAALEAALDPGPAVRLAPGFGQAASGPQYKEEEGAHLPPGEKRWRLPGCLHVLAPGPGLPMGKGRAWG